MSLAESYRRQVQLLLDVLPLVSEQDCFALKGGTAINLRSGYAPALGGHRPCVPAGSPMDRSACSHRGVSAGDVGPDENRVPTAINRQPLSTMATIDRDIPFVLNRPAWRMCWRRCGRLPELAVPELDRLENEQPRKTLADLVRRG